MGSKSSFGCCIFLHLSHAVIGILNMMGFHVTGMIWDENGSTKTGVSLSSGGLMKSCQGPKSYDPISKTCLEDGGPDSGPSFIGRLWTLELGLLCLSALGVMITLWTPQLLKNMVNCVINFGPFIYAKLQFTTFPPSPTVQVVLCWGCILHHFLRHHKLQQGWNGIWKMHVIWNLSTLSTPNPLDFCE